jgi:hypothetical protein
MSPGCVRLESLHLAYEATFEAVQKHLQFAVKAHHEVGNEAKQWYDLQSNQTTKGNVQS